MPVGKTKKAASKRGPDILPTAYRLLIARERELALLAALRSTCRERACCRRRCSRAFRRRRWRPACPTSSLPSAVSLTFHAEGLRVVERHRLYRRLLVSRIHDAGDLLAVPVQIEQQSLRAVRRTPLTAPLPFERMSELRRHAARCDEQECRVPGRRATVTVSLVPPSECRPTASAQAADAGQRSADRGRLRGDSGSGCSPGRCTQAARRPLSTERPTPS